MKELLVEAKKICEQIKQIKINAIPYGYEIDLDALENVSIFDKGEQMTPDKILKFFYEKGVIITRGVSGITKIDSPTQFQLSSLYNELIKIIDKIKIDNDESGS